MNKCDFSMLNKYRGVMIVKVGSCTVENTKFNKKCLPNSLKLQEQKTAIRNYIA